MILNIGCGGRKGDKDIWYGDYRIDLENFPNVTHVMDAHFLPDIWTDMFDEVVCNVALDKEIERAALNRKPFEIVSRLVFPTSCG